MNPTGICNLIIILGISGDLARKKIMPTLWTLYNKDLLPNNSHVIGFARSNLTVASLRDKVTPHVNLKNEAEQVKYDRFWMKHVEYVRTGSGTIDEQYASLNQLIKDKYELKFARCNRLFYFALPPHVYSDVAKAIKHNAIAHKGAWTRLVLEKPFGSDLESSNNLSTQLSALFSEDQIYRMDHYLGKEMLQNILPFRFANQVYEPLWNRKSIESVEILFKESFGTYGRGGYFDKFGIIRDVVQNHLLQALVLVAMDEPSTLSAQDVRNQKVKLLKSMRTLVKDDVVLGQYVGNLRSAKHEESRFGYVDDPTVSNSSQTATYSLTILHIDNDRWRGVPFVIRAGKAMDLNQIEIRIYFKTYPNLYSSNDNGEDPQNILIMRIQPNEAILQRMRFKRPGIENELLESTMSLIYSDKFKNADIVDAYERLLLDIFQNSQVNFVRTDELEEAWRVFTPVLHQIDAGEIKPYHYEFGSSTLKEGDALLIKYGLIGLI
ncbi:hypothetical protein RDWZM_000013 [Blomia tropicalis]|uniref:Glucose-6-phosphate 1-dehydrogenase n=1 Tax=Blomia tropicalis TaxID=40697 RepID=A0A9Q0RMJ8_BLOTA|nr:hypothetical protein RDWZM_000013 [Blomia tropicalis]